jgi:hypothetical protein
VITIGGESSKNARFWHIPDLLRFMLPQTPFKTDVVFEGL